MIERSLFVGSTAMAPPERPETIAVIVGQLGRGGTERQLYFFLARCDRARWAPMLFVSGELGYWEAPIRELGIPVILLRGSRFAKLWRFRNACIAHDIKCFFSWSSYTNGFGLALGRGTRRIGSFRNSLFADLPSRLRWLWSWLSLAGVTTVVCNSREVQLQLSRCAPKKSVAYIPNAVEIFSPENIQTWRAQWRERMGLRDDTVLVLGVGRLSPEKNFWRFIDVVARLAQDLPIKAVIAGRDLGCGPALQDQIARLGLQDTIRLIGEVPDARQLIAAADIFLLSSDREGMPNVVLEAMAAGVPCVTTDVNSVADLIEPGSTGFVTAQDVDALAQSIASLAVDADLRRAMGARARAAIEREYRSEQVLGELWKICEQ